MKWYRVQTILLQSYYHLFHSKETWVDLLWFTSIQFIIFGFIAQLLAPSNPDLARNLITGFVFWETVRIGQYCVSVGVMWDVWSRSLSSMFIAPLTMPEMLLGHSISGFVKTALVISILSLVGVAIFHISIFSLGLMIFVYFFLLILFSFAIGAFIFGLILRYGVDIQSFAWGLIYIFEPISAVFYPVQALPANIRWIAFVSPITFIMEAIRYQLNTQQVLWGYLGWSVLLIVIYGLFSFAFLNWMYKWSRKTGAFARLGN